MFPQIEDVTFEDASGRLKVVMPAGNNPIMLAVYSVLLLSWIGASIWMITLLFGASIRELSTFFIVVWIIILFVWTYLWLRLGRSVWRWWQYYAARREILFVDKDVFMVRRPLSLLGVTDAYDMEYVGPFYYNEKYDAIAFDYGARGGTFGTGLDRDVADQVIGVLNARYFPGAMLEEEE